MMTGNPKGAKPRISIIVAMAKNRVIGVDNTLPWHLPADLKRFKALTMGHHIIMGRKTFESIGRILPGRTSVVVTRNPEFNFEGILVAHSLREALEKCASDDEIFVIGGEEIFHAALPLANRIHATEIAHEYEGNTYFPELDHAMWRAVSADAFSDGQISGRFVTYEQTNTR
jgi:dihydrofolate reductase